MTVRGSNYAYQYDVNGNMVREHTTRHFEWDHSDQMRVFRNQVIGGQPSVHVQYLYDADGQRVKKLVRKQNGGIVEVAVYIDEMFEHHRQVKGGVTKENNTLHVMDDERRIAMVRVGNALDASDTSPAVQYQFGDHLESSNVVVNADGTWSNREEFTPYGETSFGRYAGKRYRFTGKERDEESGFNYHGARYYAPWLGRWMILDPVGGRKGNSRYVYVHNNPLKYVDCKGTQESLPPDRRKIFENLRTKLLMDTSDLAETANNIFMHLHALQYITYEAYVRKLTAWTTPFSAKETYRKPTKLEQKEAAELINSFIAKSINEAVLSNNTKHLEGKSLELYILKRAFRISQKVRQGADVKDTPSLVAAEQYLTARTLFATPPTGSENIDVPEQYVNGVTAVAATFFYDEIVKNTPILSYPLTLFLKASKKPMSPPWVWTRAWKYLGSWHIINPPK
jgi:RHS repeat-associated protein